MKLISGHQPSYLPWLGLYHKLYLCDEFFIWDHVQLSHYDYTAKNFLKGSNGPLKLVVPLLRSESNIIRNVKIDNQMDWKRKHWSTIKQLYSSAPYFETHRSFLESFYKQTWTSLLEMTTHFLEWSTNLIGIDQPIHFSSSFQLDEAKDRGVLELVKKNDGNCFIFGEKGVEYCDVQLFKNSNVYAYFQNYKHPIYQQKYPPFVSNLSILDLIMNVPSKECLNIIVGQNDTREAIRLFAAAELQGRG